MKKKTMRLIAFLAAAMFAFLGLSEMSKDINLTCVSSIKGFYTEPEDSLDAVMIGASEVYTGYCPTQGWKEHGYTSYNFACMGVPGNLYKSMVREVMRKQHPKLVVFEINGFIHDDDYFTDLVRLHRYIDSMKVSENWVDTIRETVPEESRKDFFLPISTYHDNWKHPMGSVKTVLTKNVLRFKNHSNLKGMATMSMFREQKKIKADKKITLTEKGKTYLEDLCRECKELGVENVLFVRFPHLRKPKDEQVIPQVEQIVTSHGYDFLDANDYASFGLDKDHDFYNSDHLNFYGMQKFTTAFSDYLTEQYDLPSSHDEDIEQNWAQSAKQTDEILNQCEEDVKNGEVRHYTEMACYVKPFLYKEE